MKHLRGTNENMSNIERGVEITREPQRRLVPRLEWIATDSRQEKL